SMYKMGCIAMLETLRRQFADPSAEFSPIPFWFWNDELSREEIIRQIHDFHAKEVNGFVIHPRMGLPRTMPYLSDAYMDLVEAAVAEAAKLNMTVILYDEGMYPSGSACGLVVCENPEYASRGLRMEEHRCAADGLVIPIPAALSAGESLVSAQAVRKLSDREVELESAVILRCGESGELAFTPPDDGDWSVLLFIETDTKGTIRGVHPGQDDGEPDAPLAADLLHPGAVQTFIALTHEKYYARLSAYFGSTIIAMFTDEPDLLGRGHLAGLKPWTRGFMDEFLACGSMERDLPALWLEARERTSGIRRTYEATVRNRLARVYYKTLAEWCEAHGIALTGHPAASEEIGLLEHFHIPGQDVVWRYIAPEAGKAIEGTHSTMGKCSSDAARHSGKRRNLNECFGVCGKESGWALSADEMKWYLDWLFVRGVNLISPHAFYYSIRGDRRDERPPDVGPNNIWWPEYRQFSRYIKRMSWLMTDIVNTAEVAVLAQEAFLPWAIVKPLYERQIEFNYTEERLLAGSGRIEDGVLRIAKQSYKAVLIEDGERVGPAGWQLLEAFVNQGGVVIELSASGSETKGIGQFCVRSADEIPALLDMRLGGALLLHPPAASIRISCVTKQGVTFYVLVNEGEERYEGALRTALAGRVELWRPWTGAMEVAGSERSADGCTTIGLVIERRECVVIAIDPRFEAAPPKLSRAVAVKSWDLSKGWWVQAEAMQGMLQSLSSWTEWSGMKHDSGTVTYERIFTFDQTGGDVSVTLDLGDAHELAKVWVNGTEAGVRMWKPYVFDIGGKLRQGDNDIRVEVTNSLANHYDHQSLPSGLIGPITVKSCRIIRGGANN
ncbi:MAG: hypothetical protein K0Q59_4590, partial [Paenibacillus sp.]|nr:hypothetical protein [Paenibacillus sp.]